MEDATANIQPAFFSCTSTCSAPGLISSSAVAAAMISSEMRTRSLKIASYGNSLPYSVSKTATATERSTALVFNSTLSEISYPKEWPGLTPCIHIDPLCIQQCAIHIENNYFCHTLSLLFSLRQLCSPVNRYSVPRFLQNPGRIQGRKPP